MLTAFDCDTLIAPTHHFGGASQGNLASTASKFTPASPKQAALQGLQKMKKVFDLGGKQLITPPAYRPIPTLLSQLGFTGTFEQQCQQAFKKAPTLLSAAFSASSMWMANAGTFIPKNDTPTPHSHFVPANLSTFLHRRLETLQTAIALKWLLPHTQHHGALLPLLRDEGAANHTRLGPLTHPGLHVFVYGKSTPTSQEKNFPARQSIEACKAIAALAHLPQENSFYFQQHPEAIAAGAFHNDVVAVGHHTFYLCHERAYLNQTACLETLQKRYNALYKSELTLIELSEKDLSLQDAISTYVFNSQFITSPEGELIMLCPTQCQTNTTVKSIVENTLATQLNLTQIHYVELNESMKNGGGPACLRLRLQLTKDEENALPKGALFSTKTYDTLSKIVEKWYPDRLDFEHLCSPSFHNTLQTIYTQLESIKNT